MKIAKFILFAVVIVFLMLFTWKNPEQAPAGMQAISSTVIEVGKID